MNKTWYGILRTSGMVHVSPYISADDTETAVASSSVVDVTGIIRAQTKEDALKKARLAFGVFTDYARRSTV